MATTSFSLSNALGTSGTQSYLNTWGQAIVSALTACGLVQTSDTGQVNWSSGQPTVVTGSGGTTYGYQIWRFNDSLQSTKPVYIKVTYAQGTTNGALYLQFQVGTSTNGAGTLGGVTSGSTTTISMAQAGAQFSGYTSGQCYGSGDGSYLALALNVTASGTATGSAFLYIDRTRDTSGAATGEGLTIGLGSIGSTSSLYFGILSFTASTTATSASYPMFAALLPTSVATSMAAGTTVYVAPCVVIANGKLLPPALAAVAYYTGDTTTLTPITVNISGAAHTYLPLGNCVSVNGTANTVAGLAMRYE